MYIEDLVTRIACYGKWIFDPSIKLGSPFEEKFINSVAQQLDNGNGFTEKQAMLAVRIVKTVEHELIKEFGAGKWDLDDPVFKMPIRTISQSKHVTVDYKSTPPRINVYFPYNETLVAGIKEYKKNKLGFVADWSPEDKCWAFALGEENICFIQRNLIPVGFTADEDFKELVGQITAIELEMENHVPMLSLKDGRPQFVNVFKTVPQPADDNVIKSLFLARKYGITTTDDNITEHPSFQYANPVTKTLLNTYNHIWVDKRLHGIEQFADVVDYAQPLLIVVPGGNEYEHVKNWHGFLKLRGIKDDEISVMFRLPNEGKGDFNIYVRDHKLNNELTENTKVVFISVKVPKPLIKTNIKFDAIINLGYYMNTHYSLETLLRSVATLIFYTDQEPKINKYPTYGYR